MRFSWDEIIYDHDKWGAQRYPLFAYADGTGRVSCSTSAYEIGTDEDGQSLPDEAYPDGQMANAAIEKLREYADDGTPFCLAVGFFKPHLPFNAPKAYWDLYDPQTLPPANPLGKPVGANPATTTDSAEINAYTNSGDRDVLRHAYFACVSYVAAQVGRVLDELESLGLADDTIVVLWGDHGWCLDYCGMINTNGDFDLYDLSAFRYEREDVSVANPSVVNDLSVGLTMQGTRSGTTYTESANGNPLLANPDDDGDHDGVSNKLNYAAGTDGLDLASKSAPSFSLKDLTGLGFSNRELVYRLDVATDTDELTLLPFTSTDLQAWSSAPLEFLDMARPAGAPAEFRFRLTGSPSPKQFFRYGTSD